MQEMSSDYRILHAMAAALGHVCISLHVASGETTMQDVARLAREFGETLTAITQSAADGVVTPNEMQHCERQAVELQAAINAALANLRGMMPAAREHAA